MIYFRALTLFFFTAVSGFCFELKSIPQISPTAFLRWDLADGPIAVSLDQRGSADLPLAQAEKALVSALNSWQSVSGQSMRFQYTGTVQLEAAGSTDQINSVQWIENGWDYSAHAIAVTSYSYYLQDPPSVVDADIFINGEDYQWTTDASDNGGVDVQQVLIHELGHLLGIAHTSVSGAQMFPYISGNTNHKVTRDDRAALKFLYGTSYPQFATLTPIRKARYVTGISAKKLPLPVFRWTEGLDKNYIIEFSGSPGFEQKIRVRAGPYPFYELTPAMEKKLLKLSPVDKIFWRVQSGSALTPARSFRFV